MELDYQRKTYAKFGERVNLLVAHSEAAMSMRISGLVLTVELIKTEHGAIAQVYKDGKEYSFPITVGEAGFYQDKDGYYFYTPCV